GVSYEEYADGTPYICVTANAHSSWRCIYDHVEIYNRYIPGALACSLAAAEFSVSGLGGFNVAMVTKGGISLDEVSLKTMESKRYPGLYFIGEVLDIDGDTGGYNLQFAYSSAMAAADNIFAI
ncbi:MAG: NAD(P)/FAD-dependent oxidoreductase, partial [Firmicutes bacterium]|nr:NAD(P)/FAD-dependent oxidoreductase [Bacillota bacterium]